MRGKRLVKRPIKRLLRGLGYDLMPLERAGELPADFTAEHEELWMEVTPYTMTSPEAVYTLVEAVRYVVSSHVPGSFVECGVWRGGSMLAVARTLLRLDEVDRDLYLFDTFEGMSEPTDRDELWSGERASTLLAHEERTDDSMLWAQAPLAQVERVMRTAAYPASHVHFVQGMVEDTIPGSAPDEIAVLRLDTDWYESTRHELIHLYPRLAIGGVLILDDYGWWRGAGAAVDEYFAESGGLPFLVRIDNYGRRVAVKVRA